MRKMTAQRWDKRILTVSIVSGSVAAAIKAFGVQQEWLLVLILLALGLGAAAFIGFFWWQRPQSPPPTPTPRSTRYQLNPLKSEKSVSANKE